MNWNSVSQKKHTWGGGKTPEDPGNQLLLTRGSAETMVISGRLEDKP